MITNNNNNSNNNNDDDNIIMMMIMMMTVTTAITLRNSKGIQPITGVSTEPIPTKLMDGVPTLFNNIIIIRIFTQGNPSVHCTVIIGVLHIELH